jgi:copper chaperone
MLKSPIIGRSSGTDKRCLLDLPTGVRITLRRQLGLEEIAMLEFKVGDMSCSHCVGAVTKAVKEAEPAASVDIDLDSKRVRIDGAKDATRLEAAIRDAGYTPERV